MGKIGNQIEKLLVYAAEHLGLDGLDAFYARNALLELFGETEPGEAAGKKEIGEILRLSVPDGILEPLGAYAIEKGLAESWELPNFFSKVMGFVTPAPSVVRDKFLALKAEKGAEAATDYLYDLQIKNNYIQKTALSKNLYWKADAGKNYMEITVNLAKPEKSNAEVAKLLTMQSADYPKCNLCPENLGFPGGAKQGARQNLRFVPVTLDGEQWYLQYSPFIYFEEHCIIFSEKHVPMKVDKSTVRKLFDFTKQYPHYFVGSNAALPIVGGSILNHEHFQAGRHLMPVHFAPIRRKLSFPEFSDILVEEVEWFNNVIRVSGKDDGRIVEFAGRLIDAWTGFSDEATGVFARTTARHNAVTPIARILEDGTFSLDIILRNNRCSAEHPDGIFHAHAEYHNIKKESIGLIEAMGLYILPGRLERETKLMTGYLTGEKAFSETEFAASPERAHTLMLKRLSETHGAKNSLPDAERIIRSEINRICAEILKNTAVFKADDAGRAALDRFLGSV